MEGQNQSQLGLCFLGSCEFFSKFSSSVSSRRIAISCVLSSISCVYSKYKFMETQMLQQKKSLMQKVPDIQTALRAVDFLIKKKVILLLPNVVRSFPLPFY